MDPKTRPSTNPLKPVEVDESELALQSIIDSACEFHFHQLVERLLALKGESDAVRRPRWLKIRPSDWLSFPASDVRRVRALSGGGVEVEATFGGFYGVDAPLPQYFLEDVTRQDDKGKRIQAFLDVFNNQAYWLRHLGWRKFHLLFEPGDNNLFQRLASVQTGSYHRRLRGQVTLPGAMITRTRSAVGIESVLRETLARPDLEIDDTAIALVEVEPSPPLDGNGDSKNLQLGDRLLLGQRVPVQGRKVVIRIPEVSLKEERALRPDGEQGKLMAELLREYLPAGVGFDVHITLAADSWHTPRLGDSDSCLGRPLKIVSPETTSSKPEAEGRIEESPEDNEASSTEAEARPDNTDSDGTATDSATESIEAHETTGTHVEPATNTPKLPAPEPHRLIYTGHHYQQATQEQNTSRHRRVA